MSKYKVLKAISYKGSRFEIGQEVEMADDEAQNIGVEYVEKTEKIEAEDQQQDHGEGSAADGDSQGSGGQEQNSDGGQSQTAGAAALETGGQAQDQQ